MTVPPSQADQSCQGVAMADMPLRAGHWHVLAAASMEQIIGAATSTVAGVMIPMMQLCMHPELSPMVQGLLGASDLVGIAVGSSLIGNWSNRQGYLRWFRICPLIILAGCLLILLVPQVWVTVAALFIVGIGIGGGYSLDSAYISEVMPKRWRLVMVGIAKATCAIGFLTAALICFWIIETRPIANIWNYLILIIAGFAVIAFLLRIHFAQSPLWLMQRGEAQKAQVAARKLLGPGICVRPIAHPEKKGPAVSIAQMFKGMNLNRVILTGLPWACEGVGVYGVGVFLPMLIMALGIDATHSTDIHSVLHSVQMTAVVNFFIIPGFVVGLIVMRRLSHIGMLSWGFVGSAAGLALLWLAYTLHLPLWVTIAGFLCFEFFISAGPHLITFVLPSQVFPVDERATGAGIAATVGKVGAILGVFFMPLLLKHTGITGVLWVCVAICGFGALVSEIYGRRCGLR